MKDNYRHEYKYLISKSAAQLLHLRLPHFMKPDKHTGPTGRYTIRSLYFEDPGFTAFRDKIDGVDNRTKYRIRCYNYSDSFFRLECKEKKGALTRKTGQTLTAEDTLALQQGKPLQGKGELAETLHLLCRTKGLRPMVLVDYDRTPFVCSLGNTRITLDENLRTRPYRSDLSASGSAMIPVLEGDQVILEVKFDDFLPGYLSDILADIPKIPMAISKFALCMEML